MTRSPVSGRNRRSKLLLLVGFLALAAAVATAYREPAVGYELSIYAATPGGFWIGAYAALFVGIAIAMRPDVGRLRVGALWLSGCAVASILALPILRGYHFYGTADALTHLGWVRDLSAGTLDTFTFIYPGLHGLSVVLNRIGGYSLDHGVMVAVFLLAVVFVLFVAFTTHAISDRAGALAVGAFSAFPLLPVNNVGFHLRAHAFSLATFFAALVLFLLVRYVTGSENGPRHAGRSFLGVSPFGALFVVAGAASVLYHPQVATDLIIVLAIVCAIQFVVRWRRPEHPIASHRTLYVPTAVVAAVYAAWTLRTQWFYETVGRHATSLLRFLLGEDVAGGTIAAQGTSIVAIGGGIVEIFVKLFAVNLVFGVLAAVLVLLVATGRLARSDADTPELVTYLAAGGVGVFAMVVLYILASVADMSFRHLGLLSLLVSVLGAVAILEVGELLSNWTTPGRIRVAITILFVIAVPLGLATAYQSPYIHKASQHVTEAQVDGYEFAFEQAGVGGPQVTGVRVIPSRYGDAIHGTVPNRANQDDGNWNYRQLVPPGELGQLRGQVEPGYVVVTNADRQREVAAYRGIRHGSDEFRSLDAQAGVNRVHSTGESEIYLVR